jgi:hypothetical protein
MFRERGHVARYSRHSAANPWRDWRPERNRLQIVCAWKAVQQHAGRGEQNARDPRPTAMRTISVANVDDSILRIFSVDSIRAIRR